MQHFATNLKGEAMNLFGQYELGFIASYATLKDAFLKKFRTKKTPEDVLKKLRDLRQWDLLVEDYAQEL